jgi:hypothetical protein
VTPPEWAQPHPYAEDFDRFWLVRDLPPLPWPEPPPGAWDEQAYGPKGTVWLFSSAQLRNRLTFTGFSQGYSAAIKALLTALDKELAAGLPPEHTQSWMTPGVLPAPPTQIGPQMRYLQTTILGKLDLDESIAHVLKWRNKTVENFVADTPAVKAFGDKVRDLFFTEFLAKALNNGANGASLYMPNNLVFTEVRTALLEQTGGGPWVERTPTGTVKHPGSKPVWVVPSQISAFTTQAKGFGGVTALPYEVAMAITHNTNFRGPRFRGRTYVGPLVPGVMGSNGNFAPAIANAIGAAFGGFAAAVAAQTDYELHIVSNKYATSAKVIGTRVGVVPDSQRRRRRSKSEAYTQVAGGPIGSQ